MPVTDLVFVVPTTTVTTTPGIKSLNQRLGAGLSYLILSALGIIANLLVIYALFVHRKVFRKYSFYLLAAHLLVASMGILLGQFVVAIPLSFAGEPLYGDEGVLITLASGDTLFFFAIFFFSALIVINRLCSIFASRLHYLLFEDYRIHLTCIIPWLLAIFWVITSTAIGCPKVFRHEGFYYRYRCKKNLSHFGHIFMTITKHICYTGPAIMLILYLIMLIHIRMKRTSNSPSGTERNIIVQAVLICTAFEVEAVLFAFLPHMAADWGLYCVSLLSDWTLILNASINPLIMLFFNQRVKSTVLGLVRRIPKSEPGLTDYRVYEVEDDFRKTVREETRAPITVTC